MSVYEDMMQGLNEALKHAQGKRSLPSVRLVRSRRTAGTNTIQLRQTAEQPVSRKLLVRVVPAETQKR